MVYKDDYTKTAQRKRLLIQETPARNHDNVKDRDNIEDGDNETPDENRKPSHISYHQHGNDDSSIEESWTHGVSQQPTSVQNVAPPRKLPPAIPPPTSTEATFNRPITKATNQRWATYPSQ
jgi:hypothetical protein